MLPAMCKLETVSENKMKRKRTKPRREEAAKQWRVDTRVVQICYLWNFFLFFFIFFVVFPRVGGYLYPKSCWVYPRVSPACKLPMTGIGIYGGWWLRCGLGRFLRFRRCCQCSLHPYPQYLVVGLVVHPFQPDNNNWK